MIKFSEINSNDIDRFKFERLEDRIRVFNDLDDVSLTKFLGTSVGTGPDPYFTFEYVDKNGKKVNFLCTTQFNEFECKNLKEIIYQLHFYNDDKQNAPGSKRRVKFLEELLPLFALHGCAGLHAKNHKLGYRFTLTFEGDSVTNLELCK